MREEELKLEKIKKSCNITAKVAFALEIILIVATVLCVVGGSICFAFSSQIDQGVAVAMSQADKEEMVGSFASVDETSFGGLLQFTFNTDNLIENAVFVDSIWHSYKEAEAIFTVDVNLENAIDSIDVNSWETIPKAISGNFKDGFVFSNTYYPEDSTYVVIRYTRYSTESDTTDWISFCQILNYAAVSHLPNVPGYRIISQRQ